MYRLAKEREKMAAEMRAEMCELLRSKGVTRERKEEIDEQVQREIARLGATGSTRSQLDNVIA